MRKIILAALVLTLGLSSAAYADRDHRGRDRDRQFRGRGNHGVVVRDHRNWNRGQVRWVRDNDRRVVRHHYNGPRIVYANNGYYAFGPNIRYRYTRPVIARRYFDIRYRPRLIVENYAPVTGYIWVRGHWNWNSYEWIWVPGHYEIDQSYYDSGYDDYGPY